MRWENPGHEFDRLFENPIEYRLWGAAELGHKFVEQLEKKLHIVQIVDIDKNKQGSQIGSLVVQAPEELIYNEKSVVVVTCSFYEENRPFIESKGYTSTVNLFYYEDFYNIYGAYQEDYLRSRRIDISLTEKCTLHCSKCNMFMPYFKNPRNQELQDVLSDIAAYFTVVDEVGEMNLLGGEPFLYPEVDQVVDYIGQNYIDRIAKVVFFTNAMIVPSDELCVKMKKYEIQVQISDYTTVSPYTERLQSFCRKMVEYEIQYKIIRFDTWGDFGFPENCNDLPEDRLVPFFNRCRAPFRGLWKKRVYFCHLETSAIRAELYQDNEKDYFFLEEGCKLDTKRLFAEFDQGFHEDGFVSFCRKCRGCDCVNSLTVPAAQQRGKS